MGCYPGQWQDGSIWCLCGGAERVFTVGYRCPRGAVLSKVSAFGVVIPDSLLAFPGICPHLCLVGSKDQADLPVPEGVPGRRSTGRGEGRLSFPRIAFQPLCQAGAAGTLMVQGQRQPLKERGCIMRGWAGLGRQKPHLLNTYRPSSAGEHSILSLMDVQENTSSTS